MTATTRFSLMIMVLALTLVSAMALAQASKAEPVVAIITSDNGEIYAEYEDGTALESIGGECIDNVEWRHYVINGVKVWYDVKCGPDTIEESYHAPVSLVLKVFDDGTVQAEYEDGTIPRSFESPGVKSETAYKKLGSQASPLGECCKWRCIEINGDLVWICVKWC